MLEHGMLRTVSSGGATYSPATDIFGDGSGVAFYRLDGNANDESGNYHGTETAITYGGGVYERGAVFNGTSSQIINNSSINMTNDISMSIWFKTTSTASTQSLLSVNETTSKKLTLRLDTGNVIRVEYGLSTTVASNVIVTQYSFASASNGSWHNLVLSKLNGVLSLYVNGIAVSLSAFATGNGSVVQGVIVGVDSWATSSQWFNGSIDEVRIFNRAITAGEVATLYAEAEPTSIVDNINPFGDGSLKALYKFENDATDATGVYNGTATNVTYGTGKFGQCGVFNGSTSDVYNDTLRASIGINRTLSFWINSSYATRYMVLDIGGFAIDTQPAAGKWQFVVKKQGTGRLYWENTFSATANAWTHIVVVATNDTSISLYKDGTLVSTTTTADTENIFAVSGYVGRRGNDQLYRYSGSIDQLRIFNKALTPLEVASLYNETTPLEEPMYKLVDPFKDGSGKALYRLDGNALDESGNYNAVITGTLTYTTGTFGRCGLFNETVYGLSSATLTLPASSFSISAYVNITSLPVSNAKMVASIGARYFYINDSTNSYNWAYYDGTGFRRFSVSPALNTSYFACLVISGTSASLYLNGVLHSSISCTSSIPSGTVSVGGRGLVATGVPSLIGTIDQVRIFNRALTSTEVTKLFTGEANVVQ